MKRLSRRIGDLVCLYSGRLLAAACAGIKGFSAARTSLKFLLAILAVVVPLSILMLQPSSKAFQVAIFVNTLNDPQTPGPNGACSLREAIENANDPGVDHTGGDCPPDFVNKIGFSVSGTITLGSTLPAITGTVIIDGTLEDTVTVDGASSYQVMVVNSDATLTLNDITIADGNATSGSATDGGGVSNSGTLTATNCTFNANGATGTNGLGGGINNNGTLTVSNSLFSGNYATNGGYGGGGGIFNASTLTVTNSTFSSNSASNGGGIRNTASATVSNSTFASNGASYGGGIHNEYGGVRRSPTAPSPATAPPTSAAASSMGMARR
jgi:CSLREA domain-containing protein